MMGNNREYIWFSYDLIGNGCFQKLTFVVIIYLSCFLISPVAGSIHEYQNRSFIRRSNSFFFHGRSEGLYASKLHVDPQKKASSSSPEDNHLNGKSFIRRSVAKFALYLRFTNSLAISVLLSNAWICYELYFNAADPFSELWPRAWIIPAIWNLLTFVVLIVICILWAPSNNPTRYAYTEETGDDLEEERISLTSRSVILAGESATKLERKVSNVDLFGLVEEFEEDNRE